MSLMKERMHIAHFSNTYHPVVSGVVRSISTFRRALTELGHNVFIFAQQTSDYEDEEPFIFRYPSLDLPMMSNYPLTIPISPFVDKLLPALKLDVIHVHHPFLLGQAAANKAEELDLPMVFTFHTRYREYTHYVALSQELVKDVVTRWVGEYLQKCHHVVVPSQSMKEILQENYGITEQVTVVPTGIELEPYRQADGQPIRQQRGWGSDRVFISVGRLAKEKNWETLLEATAQVAQKHEDVRLAIIGHGDDRQELEEYAQELGIGHRVEFVGKLPFEEVPRYLKAADLFCTASITETQGLVTMEAMAADLPVVAVDAPGTRDAVDDGQQGLLTENTSEALAAAMERLLSDEELHRRFVEAVQHKVQEFEATRQAERLVEVYHQAQEDKAFNRLVQVDKNKRVFEMIDEEQLFNLLKFSKE